MKDEEKKAVKEALDRQMRKESFERALGKTMRRRDLSYEQYVEIMSQVRELVEKRKVSVEEAARFLIDSKEDES